MAAIEFSLDQIDFDNEDRKFLIDEVLTDDDKWNITYDCFIDDPVTIMMWLTDDMENQETMERCYTREKLEKLYNHLKTFYQ